MMKASIENELSIETPNRVGIAGELASLVADQAKINIKALWGRVINDKGQFSILTDDNSKVAETLKNSAFNHFKEQDVLVVRTTNTIGTCAAIAKRVAIAGININYLFTTIFDNDPAVVLSTNDNKKALSLFD